MAFYSKYNGKYYEVNPAAVNSTRFSPSSSTARPTNTTQSSTPAQRAATGYYNGTTAIWAQFSYGIVISKPTGMASISVTYYDIDGNQQIATSAGTVYAKPGSSFSISATASSGYCFDGYYSTTSKSASGTVSTTIYTSNYISTPQTTTITLSISKESTNGVSAATIYYKVNGNSSWTQWSSGTISANRGTSASFYATIASPNSNLYQAAVSDHNGSWHTVSAQAAGHIYYGKNSSYPSTFTPTSDCTINVKPMRHRRVRITGGKLTASYTFYINIGSLWSPTYEYYSSGAYFMNDDCPRISVSKDNISGLKCTWYRLNGSSLTSGGTITSSSSYSDITVDDDIKWIIMNFFESSDEAPVINGARYDCTWSG